MHLATVLLLGDAILLPTHRLPDSGTCDEFRLRADRIIQEAVIDPSEPNRHLLTERYVAEVIEPIRSCELLFDSLNSHIGSCVHSLTHGFYGYGDAPRLKEEGEEQIAFFSGCWQTAFPNGADRSNPEHVMIMARFRDTGVLVDPSDLPGPPSIATTHSRDEVAAVWRRLWGGDRSEGTKAFLRQTTLQGGAIYDVSEIVAKNPDRLARLSAALNLPPSDGMVWTFALEEITRDPDPRRWDPREIALLVEVGRLTLKLIEKAIPNSASHRVSQHGTNPLSIRMLKLKLALARAVGTKEAFGLLELPFRWEEAFTGNPGVVVESLNAPPVELSNLTEIGFTLNHHRGERQLYEAEWLKRHRGEPVFDSLTAVQQAKRVKDFNDYIGTRWLETESAMARADVKKVREALAQQLGPPR